MSFEATSRGSGQVLCAKSTVFSLLPLNRTREARALCVFQHHTGENLFSFLFSDTILFGLRIEMWFNPSYYSSKILLTADRSIVIGSKRHLGIYKVKKTRGSARRCPEKSTVNIFVSFSQLFVSRDAFPLEY